MKIKKLLVLEAILSFLIKKACIDFHDSALGNGAPMDNAPHSSPRDTPPHDNTAQRRCRHATRVPGLYVCRAPTDAATPARPHATEGDQRVDQSPPCTEKEEGEVDQVRRANPVAALEPFLFSIPVVCTVADGWKMEHMVPANLFYSLTKYGKRAFFVETMAAPSPSLKTADEDIN